MFVNNDWRPRANVTVSLGVRYEAQTLALPYMLSNYAETIINSVHIQALDRDSALAQARINNNLATAERLTSEAKLEQLVDNLKHARAGRMVNGVRVDRDSEV